MDKSRQGRRFRLGLWLRESEGTCGITSGDKAGMEMQQGRLGIESSNPGWSSFNASCTNSGLVLKETGLTLKFRPISFICLFIKYFWSISLMTDMLEIPSKISTVPVLTQRAV